MPRFFVQAARRASTLVGARSSSRVPNVFNISFDRLSHTPPQEGKLSELHRLLSVNYEESHLSPEIRLEAERLLKFAVSAKFSDSHRITACALYLLDDVMGSQDGSAVPKQTAAKNEAVKYIRQNYGHATDLVNLVYHNIHTHPADLPVEPEKRPQLLGELALNMMRHDTEKAPVQIVLLETYYTSSSEEVAATNKVITAFNELARLDTEALTLREKIATLDVFNRCHLHPTDEARESNKTTYSESASP